MIEQITKNKQLDQNGRIKQQTMSELNNNISNVGVNISEKATVIWNIANALVGYFKPHEYGTVILPMTVIKRFHDCLLPTHDAAIKKYEEIKNFEVIDPFMTKVTGYQFFNTSKFTFQSLLSDPDNIESNFQNYVAGFSSNVQDILTRFDFDNVIKKIVESGLYMSSYKSSPPQKAILDRIKYQR